MMTSTQINDLLVDVRRIAEALEGIQFALEEYNTLEREMNS